jgi:hypothetical protein
MHELRRKIEWRDQKGGIAQVYSTGLEYAFCTPDWKQHLPWVFCKDFLHDAIFSYLHNTSLSIYGYQYEPKKESAPFLRRMRLMVTNKSDKDFGSKVDHAVDFVNQIEKDLGIPSMTRAFRCPEPPEKYAKCGVYLFSGSQDWMLSPPLISLYTLAVRSGFAHAGGDYKETIDKIITNKIPGYQTSDAYQLKDAKLGLERLITEGYKNVFNPEMTKNYPEGMQSGNMHHRFGIVSFSKEYTRDYVPAWHPPKKEERKPASVKKKLVMPPASVSGSPGAVPAKPKKKPKFKVNDKVEVIGNVTGQTRAKLGFAGTIKSNPKAGWYVLAEYPRTQIRTADLRKQKAVKTTAATTGTTDPIAK